MNFLHVHTAAVSVEINVKIFNDVTWLADPHQPVWANTVEP